MKTGTRRAACALLTAALLTSMTTACGRQRENDISSSEGSGKTSSVPTKTASVYFLNFKPEIAQVYQRVADAYKKETGITVTINTAASGTYEQTLKSEVAKMDAPTIFQINGPVGYQSWKDYCADLKNTAMYSHLTDKSLAIHSGDGVYGIPYVVEGYGIIYNNAIMEKYFALPDRATTIRSADEIRSFDTLRAVVEDMTVHKETLGIKGVFSSTSLSAGNQWRWQTHTASVPIYYELKDAGEDTDTILAGLNAKEIAFRYADNFRNIFDLYLDNSTTERGLLGGKSVADSMAEFALGQSAMVQNGNWAWSEISEVEGNVVRAEDIRFLPIYTGMENEEQQGLCVGTENYLAINSQVSEEKQRASADFLDWLFTSKTGKEFVTNELGFIAPFDSFTEEEKPSDPLAREVLRWMEEDVTSVPWTFTAFPSEEFKNYFGDALLEYAQGTRSWEEVVGVVTDSWKSERERTGAAPDDPQA